MRWPQTVLFSLLATSEAAHAVPGDTWRIAGDRVNLRQAPTTAAEVLRQLNDGQDAVERDRQGDWLQIDVVDGHPSTGWVHHSLVRAVREVPVAAVREPIVPAVPLPIEPAAGEEMVLDEMRDYVIRRASLPKEPREPGTGRYGRVIVSPVPIRNPGDLNRVPTELVLASNDAETGIDLKTMEDFRDSVSYLNSRAWSVAGIKLFSEIEPVGGGVVQVKTTSEWFDVPKIGQQSYLKTLLDRWATAKADGGPAGVMLIDPKGALLMHETKP
ncbi:MAG: SH3 domain-containing protein [Geminicoccaceae bacterium]